MNNTMRKNLETMVHSIVNEDVLAATDAFHAYLQTKTKNILTNDESIVMEEIGQGE